MERFTSPKHLMRGTTDDELFWMLSSAAKEYPFDRVLKVAFMFIMRGGAAVLLTVGQVLQGA